MQSGLQISISTECFGFMCAPSIEDKIQFIFWIYRVEKPVDKIDDNEAVLPRVEPMVSSCRCEYLWLRTGQIIL